MPPQSHDDRSSARPPRRLARAGAVLCAWALATPLGAQELLDGACPDGRVSYVFVDNHSVFDPDELRREGSFGWAYRLVNGLHMDTRADFIEKEILISVGDCYDPFLVEESGRLLRSYSFIARADVFGIRQEDGSWHVVVDTRDEWTTELNVHFNFEEGAQFRGADLTEESLFGRGILLGAFLEQNEEIRDLGGRIWTPRLLGTRIDGLLSAGTTRVGNFFEERLAYPFLGEVGRFAVGQTYRHRKDRFTYWPGEERDFSHVLLPVDEETFELSFATRFGEPGNLTTLGLALSSNHLEFRDYPGSVSIAFDGNFDDSEPADPEVADSLRSQIRYSSATRLSLILGRRMIGFVRQQGLDALTGVQDVALGTDVGLTIGPSIAALAPTDDSPTDVFSRIRLFRGTRAGPFLVSVRAAMEGRQVLSGGRAGKGWKDVIGELDALTYWQPGAIPTHTFVGRLSLSGGSRMTLPYQLVLGGSTGVRGYTRRSYPGGRRLVASMEDRFYVPWPAPHLFDLGFTFFGDVGRMWRGGAPFGADSGWRGAIGGGLRLGFPAGTRGVIRLDLAFPVDRERAGDPVLRLALYEVVGLARLIEGR